MYKVQLFDRQLLAFLVNDKIQLLPLSQLSYAFEHNYLSENTLYVNNLVQTKDEFLTKWLIPIKDSWLANRIGELKFKV